MSVRVALGKVKHAVLTTAFGTAGESVIDIDDVEHVSLHLSDYPDLYNPSANKPMQRGRLPVYIINNAVVWPQQSVASQYGQPILQTYIDEKRVRILKERDLLCKYPIKDVSGYATTIDYIYSAHNYYHQFIDSLPRVWALRHPALRDLDITIYVPRELSAAERTLIVELVPPKVSIERVSKHVRLRPAEGYIHLPYLSKDRVQYNPNQTLTSPGFIPREYMTQYLNLVFQLFDTSVETPRKFYITRSNYSKRHFLNEFEIRRHLAQKGFETVDTGAIPLGHQARLFRDAEVVVAQLGAALTNMIYCDDAAVLEIFPSHHNHQHFSVTAKALDLDYNSIHLGGDTINDDVHLPLSKLDAALSALRI